MINRIVDIRQLLERLTPANVVKEAGFTTKPSVQELMEAAIDRLIDGMTEQGQTKAIEQAIILLLLAHQEESENDDSEQG